MTGVLIKRRNFYPETQTEGKYNVRMKAKIRVTLRKPKNSSAGQQTTRSEIVAWNGFSCTALSRNQPYGHISRSDSVPVWRTTFKRTGDFHFVSWSTKQFCGKFTHRPRGVALKLHGIRPRWIPDQPGHHLNVTKWFCQHHMEQKNWPVSMLKFLTYKIVRYNKMNLVLNY